MPSPRPRTTPIALLDRYNGPWSGQEHVHEFPSAREVRQWRAFRVCIVAALGLGLAFVLGFACGRAIGEEPSLRPRAARVVR